MAGSSGIGKTALALTVLHHAYAHRLDRVYWFGARHGVPVQQLLSAELGEAESLGALFLRAEEQGLVLVVDDAHELDDREMARLYAMLERHAVRSQWLLLSQQQPEAKLDRVVLALDAMPREGLEELALDLDPSCSPERRSLVSGHAQGSPLRLKMLLSGALAMEASEPVPASLALTALRALSYPVSGALLRGVDRCFDEAELAGLTARGLLDSSADGVRLHDATRALLGPPTPLPPLLAERLARALLAGRAPAGWLDGVSLLLGAGLTQPAFDALEDRGASLLAGGYARGLESLLAPLDHPHARRWMLRAMSRYPAAALLARMPQPPVAESADRLEFARALFRAGRVQDAGQCSLEAIPHAGSELRFDLGLLHANTAAVLGEMDVAIAEAEAIVPVLDRQSFARDAFLCRGYALVRRGADAVQLLERWAARPMPPGVSVPAGLQIVHAAQALGHLDTTRQILRGIAGHSDYDQWVIWLAWLPLELEAGHLDRAESLGERLRLEAASDSYLYPVLEHISVAIAIDRGCGTEIVHRLNALTEYLAERHDIQTLAGCGELVDDLATSGFDGLPPAASPLLSPEGVYLRWRRETLLGPTSQPPPPRLALADTESPRQAAALTRAAQAQLDALEGRDDAAAEHISRAIDIARTAGLGRLRFALLRLSAQIAVAAEDLDALTRRRDDLRVMAAEMPSRRAGAWANWCDLLCTADPPPPEAWLGLLAADHEISRLSAATLGADVVLNRWERRVIAATRRRWRSGRYLILPRVTRIGVGAAWSVDFVRDRVFAPGCEPLDLSRAAATRSLLQTLAIKLRASKQDLAKDVWGIAEYHRLRDDKRMQVAMRKLRLRIEREPSNPRRILTNEDGYCLNAEAPLILLAPAELADRVDRWGRGRS